MMSYKRRQIALILSNLELITSHHSRLLVLLLAFLAKLWRDCDWAYLLACIVCVCVCHMFNAA